MRTIIKSITTFGSQIPSFRLSMTIRQKNPINEMVSMSIVANGIELPLALGRYNKMPRKTSSRVDVYVNTTFNIAIGQCVDVSEFTVNHYHGDLLVGGKKFTVEDIQQVHPSKYRKDTDGVNEENNYMKRPNVIEVASMREQLGLKASNDSNTQLTSFDNLPKTTVVQSIEIQPLKMVSRPDAPSLPSFSRPVELSRFEPIAPPTIAKPHVNDIVNAARILVSFSKKRSRVIDTPGKRRRVDMLISSITN